MLVQQFFPSSSSSSANADSSVSLSSPSAPTLNNKNTSIHSSVFNSESTGFQPRTDPATSMNYCEKPKLHVQNFPIKLTSVFDSCRQRYSQLNPRFKQRSFAPTVQCTKQSTNTSTIVSLASRPQPRQEARSKDIHHINVQVAAAAAPPPPVPQSTRRSNTGHSKGQSVITESNQQYITLANLSKLLNVLQTQPVINDNEGSTDTSTSSTNSAKQRVQQHLQETAIRWWKPSRSVDNLPTMSLSAKTQTTSSTVTQFQASNIYRQESENLPIITIVSNSTRQLNSISRLDESESSTEIQQSSVVTSFIEPSKTNSLKRTRNEPLIMQERNIGLYSYNSLHYSNNNNNQNTIKYPQNRLIRQT